MPKYNHYHKEFPYINVDLYRIARMYGIKDNELFHAFKKILVSGKRGAKNKRQDIIEAIDALMRYLELEIEEIDFNAAELLIDCRSDAEMRAYVNGWRNAQNSLEKLSDSQNQAIMDNDLHENSNVSNDKNNVQLNPAIDALGDDSPRREPQIFGVDLAAVSSPADSITVSAILVREDDTVQQMDIFEVKDNTKKPWYLDPEPAPVKVSDSVATSDGKWVAESNPEAFCISTEIGVPTEAQFINKRCPVCNASLLADLEDHEWCSSVECSWNNWEESKKEFELNPKDILVRPYISGNDPLEHGNGIKVIHKSTKLEATCSIYTSKDRNKADAMRKLARLVEAHNVAKQVSCPKCED